MARHLPTAERGGVIDVLPRGGLVIQKKQQKSTEQLGGGKLGLTQIRKPKNIVKDSRLQKILSCMASQLKVGKGKGGTLGNVQKRFKEARVGPCKL